MQNSMPLYEIFTFVNKFYYQNGAILNNIIDLDTIHVLYMHTYYIYTLLLHVTLISLNDCVEVESE